MILLPLFNSKIRRRKIHSAFLYSVQFHVCFLLLSLFLFSLSLTQSIHLAMASKAVSSLNLFKWNLYVDIFVHLYVDRSTNLFILCRLKHTRKIFSSLNSDPFRNSIQHTHTNVYYFFLWIQKKNKKK